MRLGLLGFLAVGALATPAHAEDFAGRWKVPEDTTRDQALCRAGDVKECLRLAWTAEAGVRADGDADEKRLADARAWHDLACVRARVSPCANAARVAEKLDAVRRLATDAERARFWCADALDNVGRFADALHAAELVRAACTKLFPRAFARSVLQLGLVSDADHRATMLVEVARGSLCPLLKPVPHACVPPKRPASLSFGVAVIRLGEIIRPALEGGLAARSVELAGWLAK